MRKTNDTKNKKNVGAGALKSAQNGITLIALIITIIVMLILVAVTINMAVNGGLFENAGKAVGDTKNEINKEQELANGKVEIDGVWYDSIDDYINGNPSAIHSWTRTGDTFTCSHCDATYEMGQLVNYTATGKTRTTISATKSGLDRYYANNSSSYPSNANVDAKGAQTIERQSTNWVVLGIEDTDGDGEVYETLLITTESYVLATTDKPLCFYGATAYNNGPSEINRICEELYSNSKYGKARGMTIEDVNTALNYTPLGGYYLIQEDITTETRAGVRLLAKTTGNLTTKLKDVPVFSSLKANGTYTPDGTNTEEALRNYELNGYFYGLNADGTRLKNPVDSTTSGVTPVEKNTIFGTSTDYVYYLASRGVCANDRYAAFGPGGVGGGSAGSSFDFVFFASIGLENGDGAGLRPVVSLRAKLPETLDVFTLDDSTYYFKEGMTWEEWGNSPLCPKYEYKNNAVYINGGIVRDRVVGGRVQPNDIIVAGRNYDFEVQ